MLPALIIVLCVSGALAEGYAIPIDERHSEQSTDALQSLQTTSLNTNYGAEVATTTDPSSIPDINTEIRKWKGSDTGEIISKTVDHTYYVAHHVTKRKENEKLFKRSWVDMDTLLKTPGVKGRSEHPLLANSYRRAVPFTLSFDFPFYGRMGRNVSIATGGFCYVGSDEHPFLAATQYIAPFMANFETTADESAVLYADTGSMFAIEWRQVYLRGQKHFGGYTFQTKLYPNGNIEFVYRDIPSLNNISDTHHPKKFGLSDAYLFNHTAVTDIYSSVIKRVIYEYHRIVIKEEEIAPRSVIRFIAEPVCISYRTCAECSSATLRKFNCSWCQVNSDDGFCSDEQGLNRRRQDWLNAQCEYRKADCSDMSGNQMPDSQSDIESQSDARTTIRRSFSSEQHTSVASTNLSDDTGRKSVGISVGGVLILVLFAVGLATAGWALYAYYNPHTSSGQLLIRYRPSQWGLPTHNVRYTASVHM